MRNLKINWKLLYKYMSVQYLNSHFSWPLSIVFHKFIGKFFPTSIVTNFHIICLVKNKNNNLTLVFCTYKFLPIYVYEKKKRTSKWCRQFVTFPKKYVSAIHRNKLVLKLENWNSKWISKLYPKPWTKFRSTEYQIEFQTETYTNIWL